MSIRDSFYIEDHALLLGLLCRQADTLGGAAGLSAAQEAIVLYCNERGERMAKRCIADGRELNMPSFLLYAEYVDSKRLSRSVTSQIVPRYLNSVTSCAWADSWKRFGLSDYGHVYCSVCDESVLHGFSPELRVNITQQLTCGGSSCEFEWCGTDFSSEQEFYDLMTLKYTMLEQNTKDFLYHTAHVLSAFRRKFAAFPCGKEILHTALEAYSSHMGQGKLEALLLEAETDFSEV